MSLAIFYVSAAIWAFPCVLVGIVAGAAAGGRTRHWRTALAGRLVGAASGVDTMATGVIVDLVLTVIAALPLKSAMSRTFRARLG